MPAASGSLPRGVFPRLLLPGLFVLVVGLLGLTGCASSHEATGPSASPLPSQSTPGASPVEQRLRAEIRTWEGTPHRMGGLSRRGIDCSGFIHVLYDRLFDLQLPRTTTHQVRAGERVPVEALQAGDLVFFQPGQKTNHVGIYLSGGTFAHVSSSRGVMLSHLDERYWRRAYWTARRVLPGAAPAASHVEGPPAPEGRTGW